MLADTDKADLIGGFAYLDSVGARQLRDVGVDAKGADNVRLFVVKAQGDIVGEYHRTQREGVGGNRGDNYGA